MPPLSSAPPWGKNPRKQEGGSLEVRGWPARLAPHRRCRQWVGQHPFRRAVLASQYRMPSLMRCRTTVLGPCSAVWEGQSLSIAREIAPSSAPWAQIVAGGEDCCFSPVLGRLGWHGPGAQDWFHVEALMGSLGSRETQGPRVSGALGVWLHEVVLGHLDLGWGFHRFHAPIPDPQADSGVSLTPAGAG